MPETKTPQKFPLCEKYGLEVFGAFPVVDAKDVEQALSLQDKRIADLEKQKKFLNKVIEGTGKMIEITE